MFAECCPSVPSSQSSTRLLKQPVDEAEQPSRPIIDKLPLRAPPDSRPPSRWRVLLKRAGLGWLVAIALASSACALGYDHDDAEVGPFGSPPGPTGVEPTPGADNNPWGPGLEPTTPGGAPADWAPDDLFRCADDDFDGCDDCSSGERNPLEDGPDADGDGRCDQPGDFQPASTIVAISEAGALGYSIDGGTTWQASPNSGTWPGLRSAAAGLGRFFAVGAGERMLRSDDGIAWSEVADPFAASEVDFEVVAYAGSGEWAAGGADAAGSRVLVSYDHGLTWEDGGSPFGADVAVTGIAVHRDTGRWVAVGSPGDRIAFATRGVRARLGAWTEVVPSGGPLTLSGTRLAAVAHHRGGWTAVGGDGVAATSTDDGVTWTYLEPLCGGRALSAIVAGGTQAVAVGGDGCVVESGTGADLEWMEASAAPPLSSGVTLRSAFFDVGLDGVLAGSSTGEIGVSYDGGATWSKVDTAEVFAAADAIVGIAGEAEGAVRAEVRIGQTGSACPPTVSGALRLDSYVPDMNIPSTGDNQPRILGIGPMKNGTVQLRAGLRVNEGGAYAFRVQIGGGDSVVVLVDESAVVGCGGGAMEPVLLEPDAVADFVVRWVDDGHGDAIVVEYNGPDTDGEWAVIPASAFVRTY